MSEFKDRLNQACDDSDYVPDMGKGRQVAIAKRLGISQEAARKWFAGEAQPRGQRLKDLAQFLNVEESWLSLGTTNTVTKELAQERERLAKGAVHMLAGMIHFEGGTSAFPDAAGSKNGLVDIYAIMNGKHTALHVSTAVENDAGELEFVIPRNYADVHVVGATVTKGRVTWLDFPTTLIDNNKEAREGNYVLIVRKFETKLMVPKGRLNKFESLGEIL